MISKKMILELTEKILIKEASTDPQVKKAIELIWKEYKAGRLNEKEFSRKVGDVLKRFGMTWYTDKNWVEKFLKLLTGEEWKTTHHDFIPERV